MRYSGFGYLLPSNLHFFMGSMDRKAYYKQYRKENKTRTKRVSLTLTKAEYAAFVRASKGRKITPFVKACALSSLKQQALIPDDIQEELQTLRFAVLNIANNINQIAHHSNLVRNMAASDEHNLLSHIKQLDDLVKTYTEGRLLSPKNDDY